MDSWAAQSKSNFQTRRGYGKGFTVWNRLSKLTDGNVDRGRINEDVKSGAFDLVILSDRVLDSNEQRPFVELVKRYVHRSKVVVLHGSDVPAGVLAYQNDHKFSDWIFEREMY